MINAVGIDVSKGRSTIAVLRPGGITIRRPFDVSHSSADLSSLVQYIGSLEGDTRAVMESTGRYHEPVLHALSDAGIFVSAVNPHLIRNYGNNSLRKVKTDPADAMKIARYTIDNWSELREYTGMDNIRSQLKILNTQTAFLMKQKTAVKNNLIALLDQTYPGVDKLFTSPVRTDGSEKWVDYVYSFWHVDCVRKIGIKAFSERYAAFCKRHGYNFQKGKPQELFDASKELIATQPKDLICKKMIQNSIEQLKLLSRHIVELRSEMDHLASTLPEYSTVMEMYGVGPVYGPQLIAEIGDVSRFPRRESLTAFAGVDPGKNDSGQRISKSVHASKCGSSRLRKTLFQIMSTILQLGDNDDPVYRFLDKKRSEGKDYLVYMTAGANKFLRIYYGKVKECLRQQTNATE